MSLIAARTSDGSDTSRNITTADAEDGITLAVTLGQTVIGVKEEIDTRADVRYLNFVSGIVGEKSNQLVDVPSHFVYLPAVPPLMSPTLRVVGAPLSGSVGHEFARSLAITSTRESIAEVPSSGYPE